MQKILSNLLFSIAILFVLLALAVKLGTIELHAGAYAFPSTLDILRMEISFYFCVLLWMWATLKISSKLFYLRFIIAAVLSLSVLFYNLSSLSTSQVASEGATLEKASYWLAHLKLAWLSEDLFEFYVLVLIPSLITLTLLFVYLTTSEKDKKNKVVKFSVLAFVFLLVSFVPPLQDELDASLSYNPISYLLLTGYKPKREEFSYDTNAKYSNWVFEKEADTEQAHSNVVLIILESVRDDVVSKHNYKRYDDITPFIQQLSQTSTVFENAYTTVPHTSKALVSIHCGILPFLDLPIYESTLGVPVDCLPKILGDIGYNSIYFQSPTEYFENRKMLTREFGYDESYTAEDFKGSSEERVNYLSFADEVMVPPSAEWLSKNDSPFLATYLTGSTHHDYYPPSTFPMKNYEENIEFNAYLNSLKYTDQVVESIFEVYKNAGRYEDTIFILVGDHGEAFGEHGLTKHNNVLYEEGSKVFMMIHDKSSRQQAEAFPKDLLKLTYSSPISVASIPAIVMEKMAYKATSGPFREVPISLGLNQDNIVMGSCYERLTCLLKRKDNYKLIHNFNEKRPQLFDLNQDPLEKNSMIVDKQEEPSQAIEMRENLLKYYRFHQSAMDNYYRSQQADYLDRRTDTIIYGFDFVMQELNEIWPEQQMQWLE